MVEYAAEDVIDLSVIVVSWNTAALLRDCLTSLQFAAPRHRLEVIVVDNGSTDDSASIVRHDFPQTRLIQNATNAGFARANNQGIDASRGRYVLLLNSDTFVPPHTFDELIDFMDGSPSVGLCGPRLTRPDGQTQAYGFGGDPTLRYLLRRGVYRLILKRPLHDWETREVQDVDWVSGACVIARREAIGLAGKLDEGIFMYFEDIDWCLRTRRAGRRVVYNPHISIVHVGGQSLRQNPEARQAYYQSLEYFYTKHYTVAARFLLRCCLIPYRLIVQFRHANRHRRANRD